VAGWLEGQRLENRGQSPVKNADLWQMLEQEAARHQVDWRWVKGHAGHEGNEIADALANQAIDAMLESRVT
jgi:ribonuclease HI